MRKINTILSEILKILPKSDLQDLASKYRANRYTKKFTLYDQLVTLIYSHSKGLNSLREIETSLELFSKRLYHSGLNGMRRSSFSDAMARRDHKLFEELFYCLLKRCKIFAPKHRFKFNNELYSLDSTTVDLCLEMFPWAKFRTRKGAVKIHNLLNHSGCLPEFITITDGKKHDLKAVKENELFFKKLLPDSIISFDRAYIDFDFFKKLDNQGVYFVSRLKKNLDYSFIGQHKPIKNKNVLMDHLIRLDSKTGKEKYPGELRLVSYYDPKNEKIYNFITNNMKLAAKTIADIYKSRWDIELFFKWIKQNLKIKSFLGTSKNAVMAQVWSAMIYYLILSYIKFQSKFAGSITELHRIVRETMLERLNLIDILNFNKIHIRMPRDEVLQFSLF